MSKDKNNCVFMERLNWDIECLYDITHGKGFMITEPSEFQLDKKTVKSIHGTRSPLYGTDFSDEQACIERYRCECGAFKGLQFEGETCPICHTKITNKDIDITYTGWLSLGDNYIMSPYYYQCIGSLIGNKVLEEIVMVKRVVDRDGHISKATSEDLDKAPKSPFSGIGVAEFRARFEEIIEYFIAKKHKTESKVTALRHIINEQASVFVSKVPVYSTFLRPQSQTSDSFYFNSIDKEIEPLFSLTEKLKTSDEIDQYYTLSRIQKRVNNLWKKNLDLIIGKNGFIRDQILGGGLNYTARNVIVPNARLKMNEVKLSYHAFRILYKDTILYYIMKICGITLAQAYQKWSEGHIFNQQLYEIMNTIVQREHPKVLINRNPTLNYYSMLLMDIVEISNDPHDYSLGIPFYILAGLNADFDGDILNLIAMCNKQFEKAFEKFDPIRRMIIDRDSGEVNGYVLNDKNQLIDLYNFCVSEN